MTKRGFKTKPAKADTKDSLAQDVSKSPAKLTPSLLLLRRGLILVRRNFQTAVMITVVPALLMQLGLLLLGDGKSVNDRAAFGLLILLVAGVWLFLSTSVNYYFQLRAVSGDEPGIAESYRYGLRYLPRLIGLSLITSLAIVGGLILGVVPGLYALRRYFLSPYFLVDNDVGIRQALQLSATASKPAARYIWTTLGIMLVFVAALSGLGQLLPTYGATISSLLSLMYLFLPSLRYYEVVHGVPAPIVSGNGQR